jgi:hypothetical protein
VTTVAQQIARVPAATRPIVNAARRTVKAAAPGAKELAYEMAKPRSSRMMWKLVRYAAGDDQILAIGTFPTYATIFFYRGRELDDGSGMLEGSGKDTRFMRLRTTKDAAHPELKRLVRQAFALGAPNPAKKST